MIVQDCCFSLKDNEAKACWAITEMCNRACSYCAMSSLTVLDSSVPVLHDSEVENVSKLCIDNAINKIILSGGEPLLVPNIAHIISILTANGLSVSLSTNGDLLNRKLISLLMKSGLSKVVIGVHWADIADDKLQIMSIGRMLSTGILLREFNLSHEFSLVLIPSILDLIEPISSLISASSPSLINMIEPQKCGRFGGLSMNEKWDHDLTPMEIAKQISAGVGETEVVYVQPQCFGDCPSSDRMFGITDDIELGVCPWKVYFDLPETHHPINFKGHLMWCNWSMYFRVAE